ncbi:hypothetical protein [Leifsonia virtsii]|uniref:HEAT repeat domain-containing protein n=1 Tax=Leifsonia virtsii TaxID=3035915 RepID=A0ABT8J434_9MICO|nr:hypothetical protein [Leifsonia virtsii]MDN4599416.1 hypothetical protein [Leifsonia virtsii]
MARTADSELASLWLDALDGRPAALEERLASDSRLPGPRANLELAHRTADCAAATPDGRRRDALRLLDRWLQAGRGAEPGEPEPATEARREYLAAVAALCVGALVSVRPDDDAAALLTTATSDRRWRVRELAATGLQRVLAADPERGMRLVRLWLVSGMLPARAAVAAVAEPSLLRDRDTAQAAVRVVEQAADRLLALPSGERRAADPRVLRQALGYAVSVVAAADPAAGLPLLERLATSTDPDARWIARENLKKARLAPYADRLAVARDALSRA